MDARKAAGRLVRLSVVGWLSWHASAATQAAFDDGMQETTPGMVMDDGNAVSSPASTDGMAYESWEQAPTRPAGAASTGRLFLPVEPRWQAQVDALMLWQGNIPSRVLYVDWPSGAPALDANQAQTAMAAGVRYGLVLNLDPVYAIEGNYFNVSSFDGGRAISGGPFGQNNLAAPSIGPADGISFTSASVTTSGTIGSAELNWRRRTGGPIVWLAGFRWFEWNQAMAVADRFVLDTATTPPGSSSLDVATGNNLYGGQVGMDLCLWNPPASALQVNGVGKAGIYYNHSSFQRTSGSFVQDGLPPVQLGPVSATADQTSFAGELGVNASLRITDWLSWRAGYSFFWLTGVATPAAQLAVTNVNDSPPSAMIDTTDSILLHGVTTGLEARW